MIGFPARSLSCSARWLSQRALSELGEVRQRYVSLKGLKSVKMRKGG